MDYCNCGENKGRCIDCAEEQLAEATKELSDVRAAAKAEIKRLFGDGENLRDALAAANKEIERLQEEPSELYYQLWDEARVLRETLDEATAALSSAKNEAESLATAIWERHYKESAPQWRLCDTVAGVISQIYNMYVGLRDGLTTAREENERLTAENAALRAAVVGKTFFHSDEEVNAEMGRLRAKVERYAKALKDIALESSCSSGDLYRIHDISSDMIEEAQ